MLSPDEALKKLIEGNKRFAQDKSIHPNLGSELRNALVKGQKPFAAILSCSDSRVPIEIIFDVGLGDLFVVRSAGHVLSNEALGSIEYAVRELGVKLIMILGHGNCGAIKTALEFYNSDNKASENIQSVLDHIYPAIKDLDFKCDNATLLQNAIKSNVQYQLVDLIKRNSYLAQKIQEKEIILEGAKYKLDTGLVEIL